MRVRIPLLIAGTLLLALVAAACGDESDSGNTTDHAMGSGTNMPGGMMSSPSGMPDGMMGSPSSMPGGMMSSPQADVDPDLAFIDSMIVHHQSAVDMAKIAQEQAEHQEIKDLADEIIAAQEREINQMRDWRDEWYPDAEPTGGMPGMEHAAGMQMSESEMRMLREADPFDKAFIEMMIPHHESAIAMAKELQQTTERPELTQLIEDIITTQQAEIDQMRQWLTAWYGS